MAQPSADHDFVNNRTQRTWEGAFQQFGPPVPVYELAASPATGAQTPDRATFLVSMIGAQRVPTIDGPDGAHFQVQVPFPIAMMHIESVAALLAKLRIAAEQMDVWPELEALARKAYDADALVNDINSSTGLNCGHCGGGVTFRNGHLVSVDHRDDCPDPEQPAPVD